MAAGWDRPQECEFALCLMGQPSPYADFAFPNRPSPYPGSLDLSGLTSSELAGWKRAFRLFLQMVAVKDPRRLVLKSPPHTARLPALLDMFPNAKFVHIVRDPYVVFASTVNLWKSLAKRHGLQSLRNTDAVEEKVFREFRILHERFEEGKTLIPPGRLVELSYEEFVRDLVGGTKAIYEGLELGEYGRVRPKIEAYAAGTRNYETNKYPIGDELKSKVRERWGDIISKQGYT
jgi:omega-hydroxy-beta-dihydromenaquinone-9 sulfotransferase